MHHAYYVAGEREEGIQKSLREIERSLGLSLSKNPDLIVLRYGLLSVDDARELFTLAYQAPTQGSSRALVISADRLFHEAQNALLKLFEEPPEGTYLFLVVPAEGVLLPTLRSRMQRLISDDPHDGHRMSIMGITPAEEFLTAGKAGREKIVEKILARAKSDREEEKQQARADARALALGLARKSYDTYKKKGGEDLRLFLTDLDTFIPILYERSAPLKQIFEHILIVMPRQLS